MAELVKVRRYPTRRTKPDPCPRGRPGSRHALRPAAGEWPGLCSSYKLQTEVPGYGATSEPDSSQAGCTAARNRTVPQVEWASSAAISPLMTQNHPLGRRHRQLSLF